MAFIQSRKATLGSLGDLGFVGTGLSSAGIIIGLILLFDFLKMRKKDKK